MLSYKVFIDQPKFQKDLAKSLAKHFDNVFKSSLHPIREQVAAKVKTRLEESPEYISIMNGELWGQLGIRNPLETLNAITDGLAKGIEATTTGVKVSSGEIEGKLTIHFMRINHSEILNLKEASFKSENGFQVDWLQWLLIDGNSPYQVYNYTYFKGFDKRSRTGEGIMQPSFGENWGVPPEFAGSIGNNWITRAFRGFEAEIGTIIQQVVKSRI